MESYYHNPYNGLYGDSLVGDNNDIEYQLMKMRYGLEPTNEVKNGKKNKLNNKKLLLL